MSSFRGGANKIEPYPTADVVDQYGEHAMVCDVQFVQYGGVREFAGRIATISCDGDLALVHGLANSPGEGRVLVVDAQGSLRTAFAGDGIAGQALANAWSGLVIWGAIRDADLVGHLSIGVAALGTTPRAASKSGGGSVDVPVEFAGVVFNPGAYLFCDADGVVVVSEDVVGQS